MTTDQKGSSGAQNQNAGGEDFEGQTGNNGTEDKVSYETHRKLLGEKKKLQEEAAALKTQLQEKLRKEQEQQEKEMKDKEEWKKIVDIREKELAETKTKLSDFENGLRNSKKASAFLGELAKRGVSVRQSYYDLIDVEKIALDPSTEEIDATSVKKYADAWVTEHYELAKASNPNTKMPDGSPQGGSQLTYEEWKKLPPKEMAKRMKEVRDADKGEIN